MTARGVMVVTTAAVLAGCADRPVAPRDVVAARFGAGGGQGGVLVCEPLPYDSVTQVVGPEGGTINIGPHTLWIPQDALSTSVALTAVLVPESANAIHFTPSGLSFARQTYLLMSYANCDASEASRRVAYTDSAMGIIEYVQGIDDPNQQEVLGWVWHFSNYAIAW